jgi:hypothetical protein
MPVKTYTLEQIKKAFWAEFLGETGLRFEEEEEVEAVWKCFLYELENAG